MESTGIYWKPVFNILEGGVGTVPGDRAIAKSVKQALWPNQLQQSVSSAALNPGPMSPNPMAGQQASQAQPLMRPDQTSAQPPSNNAIAGANPVTSATSGGVQPSPLFSVPHPTSDQARWQQMVQGPFQQIAQSSEGGPESAAPQKVARFELRAAMNEGRNSWLRKLAQLP
jgi:hypothetical protein